MSKIPNPFLIMGYATNGANAGNIDFEFEKFRVQEFPLSDKKTIALLLRRIAHDILDEEYNNDIDIPK